MNTSFRPIKVFVTENFGEALGLKIQKSEPTPVKKNDRLDVSTQSTRDIFLCLREGLCDVVVIPSDNWPTVPTDILHRIEVVGMLVHTGELKFSARPLHMLDEQPLQPINALARAMNPFVLGTSSIVCMKTTAFRDISALAELLSIS